MDTTEPDEPDCREASTLLSRAEESALAPLDRRRLDAHVLLCPTCRNVADQMSFLRRAMRRLDEEIPL